MDELITWLHTQLDDDERVARGAGSDQPVWKFDPEWDEHYPYSRELGISAGTTQAPGYIDPPQAEHIARWDPARVLAEVEAKRRILDEHRQVEADDVPDLVQCGFDNEVMPCDHVRLLAVPYAGRPGWREEWRA